MHLDCINAFSNGENDFAVTLRKVKHMELNLPKSRAIGGH
jgi:hypothetical protein